MKQTEHCINYTGHIFCKPSPNKIKLNERFPNFINFIAKYTQKVLYTILLYKIYYILFFLG